jgi:hypothetical protein
VLYRSPATTEIAGRDKTFAVTIGSLPVAQHRRERISLLQVRDPGFLNRVLAVHCRAELNLAS